MQKKDAEFRKRCLIYAGLALTTICVYLPVLRHEFVNYDDQQYVIDNPRVQAGLTWRGIAWAFGFYAGNWHPLTWLSHMLDCQLYHAWAGGHHLTNVLLHVGSTLLLFAVLSKMTKAPWPSAAVAALFGWHPLHVESVAWVAERKDVLCGFFWMLTLWGYQKYTANIGQQTSGGFYKAGYYWFTLLSFSLALMAKPMAVTLPFVLLLLDVWPLKRFRAGESKSGTALLVWEKIPFILLACCDCILTLRAQQMAIVSTAGLTIDQRVTHALVAYAHYVCAMFAPVNLAVYYPYQTHIPAWELLMSAVLVASVTGMAVMNLRGRPYLLVGWLWFLGTLVPVIGLVQVGDQAWADRYTYLPLIGLFTMVVWGACDLIKNRYFLNVATVAAGGGLLTLTALQVGYWKNTRTLFEHAKAVTPNNYLAVTMLGSILANEHKYQEAIELYQRALTMQPSFPEAHFFLGAALDEQGRLDEALKEYQQALWFKPTQEQTHIFMGMALGKEKRYDEAIVHYLAALKLNPDSAIAHNNLARIYHTEGRLDKAVAEYKAALELNPKLALAHNNLGILMIQQGSMNEGILQLREALRLNETNSETQFNLALALNEQAQWKEAAELFAQTAREHGADANAHYQYAVALAHLKETKRSMSEFAAALLLRPDFPNALDGLAWILSTDNSPEVRNGAEATSMAERACELTLHKDPEKMKTLAAAYAEARRFGDATDAINSAITLADAQGKSDLAKQCREMLQKFEASEPWRQ